MSKRFFVLLTLMIFSFGLSFGQDVSMINRAYPYNHLPTSGNPNPNDIFACSDEANIFEYDFQSLIPVGQANLEFNQVQFTLPLGYTYVPGTMAIRNASGTTTLSAANVSTQPDPIGNGVLLTANLGGYVLGPGADVTLLFNAKLDCRTFDGENSLNFVAVTLDYTKNSVAAQFILDNSQNNGNSFDIQIPLMQPSYSNTPTAPLVAFRDYTRTLAIVNSGGGETKKFKLSYQIPNTSYTGLFKIRSLSAPGVLFTPTGPYEYDVTLSTPLAAGQQISITEVFYIDGCSDGTFMQVKTITNTACVNTCNNAAYTKDVVPIPVLNPRRNYPGLSMSLVGNVAYTNAPQTVNAYVVNNAGAVNAIGRDVKILISKSITLTSVDLLNNSQNTVLGSVAIINDPGSSYYELDFSGIAAANNPFTNEDADPASKLNDIVPSKSFYLRLNFSVNCAVNPTILYQIGAKTTCGESAGTNGELARISPQNTSLAISGDTDYEYNIPGAITFTGTKPNLNSYFYNTANVQLAAEITLPGDLALDFASLAGNNNITINGTPQVVSSGTKKIYTVPFTGNYASLPSSITFTVQATNTNACILYREEEVSFSFVISSSLSAVCKTTTNVTTDLLFLLGNENTCISGGGTVVYGGGGGTPSSNDIKLRTTRLDIRRMTWGYKNTDGMGNARTHYMGYDLAGNEVDETYIAANQINLKAAIENDEIQLNVRGVVVGGSLTGQDVKLRLRYNYNQPTMLPFTLITSGIQCQLKSSTNTLKATVGLEPGAAVSSGVIFGTSDNYIDMILNFSSVAGGIADGDSLIATFRIKVQNDFIATAGEYLSKIFRANYFIDNPATTISRGNRLALYQYVASGSTNGSVQKEFCSSTANYFGDAYNLATVTANPFPNEFRPLVKVEKINPSSAIPGYNISFYPLSGSAVFLGVSATNTDLYFPWGVSSYSYYTFLGGSSCANISGGLISSGAQYTTIPDGQVYTKSGFTSTYNSVPTTSIDKLNSQVTAQAFTTTVSWRVLVNASGTANHYVKFIPSTSRVRLHSYSINGTVTPYTASVQGQPIPLYPYGQNEVIFYAVYDNCTEGNTDQITVKANYDCGSGCSSQADDEFVLNLDYKSSVLALQNVPQQEIVVTGLCAGYTFNTTIASIGVADLNSINFGLYVPGTLTLASGAKLNFQGVDYALPAVSTDPTLGFIYKNAYEPDNFKIWEMKDIVNNGNLEGTHGGPSGQLATLTFKVDAVCAAGGDYYDPEEPIQLAVHATKNCGVLSTIHNTFKVIPSGYVKPTSKVRLTLATTGFKNCDKRTRVRITYNNLTFGTTSIPDNYIVELTYDQTIVSYVPDATSPTQVTDGSNPNLRKLQWTVNDITQATTFEPNFILNPGVSVQAVEFRAKARKKVVIDYCPESPIEACNKVYASVGRELVVRSKVQLPECDLIGTFTICALQEGETFIYSTTPVTGATYTWSVPSGYATITQNNGASIAVQYDNLIGAPASIGNISVTVSAPSVNPPATYAKTVYVQQPIVDYSPLVLDTECPEKGVTVNTTVRVNVTNGALNTPYSLDIDGNGTADFTTLQGYFMVSFPQAGTYHLKLVGNSPPFCSESDGTLDVEVKSYTATVTAPYICVVNNESSTININGPTGAPASNYTWYQNGQPLTGASGTSYTTQQPGTYTIVLNDMTCASQSEIDALMASKYGAQVNAPLQAPIASPLMNQNTAGSDDEVALMRALAGPEQEGADLMISDPTLSNESFSALAESAQQSLAAASADNLSYVLRYENGVYWIEVIVREKLCFPHCDPCVQDCPCDPNTATDCVPCRNNPSEWCKSSDKNKDGIANDCCTPLNEINDGPFAKCCDPTVEDCGAQSNTPPAATCEERCNGCIKLQPGRYYILTAWINESVEQTSPLKGQGAVEIRFEDQNDAVIQSFVAIQKPTTPLIDGWKRVFIRFQVPMNYQGIVIELKSSANYDIRYDDIRLHPEDGTMQSFVFDARYLRLTATLDENNYATFYDYDNEGKLTRVKKETERGIMTIRESRENLVIK